MELKINGKTVSFKFGIAFVQELNRISGAEFQGMNFGMALSTTLPALKAYDPAALLNVLFAANVTESPRIGKSELMNYFDTSADLENIFEQVLRELAKSNATKLAAKKLKMG